MRLHQHGVTLAAGALTCSFFQNNFSNVFFSEAIEALFETCFAIAGQKHRFIYEFLTKFGIMLSFQAYAAKKTFLTKATTVSPPILNVLLHHSLS